MTLIPYIDPQFLARIYAAQVQQLLDLGQTFEDPKADVGADFIGDFANRRLNIVEELAVLHGRPLGRAHELRLTLITADGAIGCTRFTRTTPVGAHKLWFPTEPDGHTVLACFQVFKRGRWVEGVTLLGDDWRDLESAVELDAIAERVLKGAELGDALTGAMATLRFTFMS